MYASTLALGVNLLAATPAVTTDSLNDVFANSVRVLTTNADSTTGAGGQVLLGIATIEFILWLYSRYMGGSFSELVSQGVAKLFTIFVVALLFFNWGAAANWVKGYIVGGASAAGGASSMVQTLNPAYIASEGFDKVASIFNSEAQQKMTQEMFGTDPARDKAKSRRDRAAKLDSNKSAFESFVADTTGVDTDAIMAQLSDGFEQFALQLTALLLFSTLGVIIVLVYLYVGVMLFVISIEWYITVTITKLLIPFAINKHTSGIAMGGVNAVFAKSVQLGVLVLVVSMFGKGLDGLALGPSPTLYEVLALLGTSATMAFCVSRVPALASAVFAGAGSGLDIGSALSSAGAAVGGAVAGAAAPVAGAALSKAGEATTTAAKMTASAAAAGVSAGAGAAGSAASGLASGAAGVISNMSAGAADAPDVLSGGGGAMANSDALTDRIGQSRAGALEAGSDGSVSVASGVQEAGPNAAPAPSAQESHGTGSLDAPEAMAAVGPGAGMHQAVGARDGVDALDAQGRGDEVVASEGSASSAGAVAPAGASIALGGQGGSMSFERRGDEEDEDDGPGGDWASAPGAAGSEEDT